MVIEILLDELHLAPGALERTNSRLVRTLCLVLVELGTLYPLLPTVVGALDWVVGTDGEVSTSYYLVRVFVIAELAFYSAKIALPC